MLIFVMLELVYTVRMTIKWNTGSDVLWISKSVFRIAVVDAYGTLFQQKELSYDIVDSEGILNKHIPESDVSGFRTI